MSSVNKEKSDIAVFEYLGKEYFAKKYTNESIGAYILMIFITVFVNISYEAILAKGGIYNIKEIGFLSGTMEERILYGVAFVTSLILIYILESMFWKIFRANSNINVISGQEILKSENIPMMRKHITFVRIFIAVVVFIIGTVLLLVTKLDWIVGGVFAVTIYYGMIIVQSASMKRINADKYIPVTISVGCIAVKENR